jgi:1,4-dihydroxy-2-naphthoate octaprenyltransferase
MVNNFRDRDQDRLSGKRTLVARFGAEFGLRCYLALGGLACALALCLIPHGMFWAGLLPLLFLVPHYRVWSMIASIYQGSALNRCLGLTSRNILIFSALLTAGILIDAAMKPAL